VAYGKDRKQFGQSIITFDMQKARVGELVARTFALDSMAYRIVGGIAAGEANLPGGDFDQPGTLELVRSFALEAAALKIFGSETLREVVDGALKIHGGYGYIQEFQVERLSRDNVIDMIYEGTNDINRLVVCDTLVRNIFNGSIGYREFMEETEASLRQDRAPGEQPAGPLAVEAARVLAAKRAVAAAIGETVIGLGGDLKNEQQVAQSLADALIAVYAMDSTLARVQAIGCPAIPTAIARLVTHTGCATVARLTQEVVGHVVRGGQLPAKLAKLEKLNRRHAGQTDVMMLRRQIGEHVIEMGRYSL